MEQHILKNTNNFLNTNIYSYLETSGGQSCNPYLNVVHFLNTELIINLWQLKTAVFLYWCLIHAFPLNSRQFLLVPLEHFLYTGSSAKSRDERFLLIDANGKFLEQGYKKAVQVP
jgi:hypothetical protein